MEHSSVKGQSILQTLDISYGAIKDITTFKPAYMLNYVF